MASASNTNKDDPELGQEQVLTDGAAKAGGATTGTSTSTSSSWLTKKNILIAGSCSLAIIALGVGVGVPISYVNKKAATAAANAAAAEQGNSSTTDTETETLTQEPDPDTSTTDEGKGEDPTVTVDPDGNVDVNTNTDIDTPIFIAQAQQMPFRFAEQLQPMSRNVMAGYESCGDLLQDVQHALESLANRQIENGRDMTCYWNPDGPYVYDEPSTYGGDLFYPCPTLMEGGLMTFDMADGATTDRQQAPTSAASTEDSYGTNNQVGGVDEADIIKSNGELVFMGYDREVIVMDLDGMVLDRVDVPLPPNATQLQPGFYGEDDKSTNADTNTDTSNPSSTSSKQGFGWGCGPPQPQYRTIKSLLMHENDDASTVTLNVITTFDDWTCDTSLCGGLTTAFIYKFDALEGKLELMASQDVNGAYNNARGIGSTNHIVTNARIDTYGFTGPLYRCDQGFWNMTYDEYQEAALIKANETVAQQAKDIVAGLSWANQEDDASSDGACKHVVQISSMTSGDDELSAQEKRTLNLFSNQGVLQNFIQITSLDLEQVTPADAGTLKNDTLGTGLGTVQSEAAGVFIAQYNPELYATASDLILAGRGWRYDSQGRWDEYTFLMSFDLNDGQGSGLKAAVPTAIGEVTGYLKNQFSMDVFEGDLRVATTSFQKWERVLDLKSNETKWMVTTNSTSQVALLRNNNDGNLKEIGFVGGLGPSEDIKSVRFIGARGYVVTFRTVDPLYSLDLRDPSNPRVMGELKISGFSEYMHPISGGDDAGVSQVGDYLLTVGKEADETDGGRITGTKIAVFDVRNITNPQMVDDFVISNEDSGWSGSDATHDHHAFRYLEESKKLILPLYTYDWNNQTNNFDGFMVYNIDIANKEISVTGNVTHSKDLDPNSRYCWGQASLPSRSMVFQGNLMTFKSHSIKMTTDVNNLVGDAWEFGEVNLDENRTKADRGGCHGYWPWMR
jgi:hypothetical protein